MRLLAEVCAELLIFQSSIILKSTILDGIAFNPSAIPHKDKNIAIYDYNKIFVKWQAPQIRKLPVFDKLLTNFKKNTDAVPIPAPKQPIVFYEVCAAAPTLCVFICIFLHFPFNEQSLTESYNYLM